MKDVPSFQSVRWALKAISVPAVLVGVLVAPDVAAAPCNAAGVVILDDVVGTNGASPFVFYEDTARTPQLRGNYVGYTVQNNGAATSGDLWVRLDGFQAGDRIQLASGESGVAHVGPLAAGQRKQVYFYLVDAVGSGTITLNQAMRVQLFPTDPGLGVAALCDYQDAVTTVEDRGPAAANKVSAAVVGPNPPELGGVITMTVVGDSGTVGASQLFSGTPAALLTWTPQAFKMFDASLEWWNGMGCPDSMGGVPAGAATHVYPQKLVVTVPGTSNSCYRATYLFYAVGTTMAPTEINPVTFIASGQLMKHTGSYSTMLQPVQPANNFATVSKSVTPTKRTDAGNVTYSVTVTNGGTLPIRVDRIVDALPASPDNASYVPGSSTFAGVAITDPTVTGQTATWTNAFDVPAGATRVLTYQVALPLTVGVYTNSVVGFMGQAEAQIDTTAITTDNVPASASVIMGNADLSITGADAPDPVEASATLTYSFTIANAGPDAATAPVFTLPLPMGAVFGSASGAGWLCSESSGTVTCTRSSLAAGGSSDISVSITTPAAGGTINATAAITSSTGDTVPDNNDVTLSTEVVQTPAAPVVTSPANNAVTNDATPTFTGTAEPNVTIQVTVDGMVIGSTTSDAAGNWTFTAPTPLSFAAHTVSATASRGPATSPPSTTNTFTVVDGCLSNTDCTGATPVCRTADYTCVRCLANSDCPASATCNTTTNTCSLAAPVVTTPANGSTINDLTPTISGTGPANVTITIFIDGMAAGTTTTDGAGNWSFTPTGDLTPGSRSVHATATSGMGATAVTSPNSNTNTFTLVNGCLLNSECSGGTPVCNLSNNTCVRCVANSDCPASATCNTMSNTCNLAAPVVSTPADGATINDLTPTISGTGPANVTITIFIDGMAAGTTTTDGAGNWSFTPAGDLTPGSRSVHATATSGMGATAVTSPNSNTNTFTLVDGCLLNSECSGGTPICDLSDNTCVRCVATSDCPASATCNTMSNTCNLAAPVLSTPANGSTTNDLTPTITGTGPANVTITVFIDGMAAGTTTTDGAGNWTFTPAGDLTPGSRSVHATATSGMGATAVTSPSSNTNTFTLVDGCLLNSECSGGTPVCNLSNNTCVRCLATSDCPASATCNTTNNTCNVPAPVVSTPANGSTSNDLTPTISGTGPANVTITIFIDGMAAGTTTTDGAGNWSFTPSSDLNAGSRSVHATATSGMGATAVTSPNSNTNAFTLVIGCLDNSECSGSVPVCNTSSNICVRCLATSDCPASATCNTTDNTCNLPAPVVSTPANGSTTNDLTPTISGTGPANVTITIFIDGMAAGTTTTDGAGNWTFTPAGDLTPGSRSVHATATSGMGAAAVTSPSSNTNTFTLVDGCLLNSECSGATPVCNTTSNICVRCLATSDCPASATCNTTDNTCNLAAPVVTAPANSSTINDPTPTITGTGPADVTINVFIDGMLAGTTTTDGAGNWSFTPSSDLSPGSRSVHTTATSGMGATAVTSPSSNTNTFTLVNGCLLNSECSGATPVCKTTNNTCVRCVANSDCPTSSTCNTTDNTCGLSAPVVTSPANNSDVNDVTPELTGTGPANVTINIFIDGMLAGTTTTDASGDWSFTPSMDLMLGSHTVMTTATSGSGVTAVTSGQSNTNTFNVVTGCLVNSECSGATPVCNTTSNTCVRCLATSDCPSGASCQMNNSCLLAAPVVSTPADGSVSNNMRPGITGTSVPDTLVRVFIDGNQVGTATTDASGNWSFSLSYDLQGGQHTVHATAEAGTGALVVVSAQSNVNTFRLINGCLADGDCSGTTPACNTTTNVCVQCTANSHCPSGATCTAAQLCALAAPVITGPTDDSVVSDPQGAITGTGVPGATITIYLDGIPAGTTTVDGNGTWTFTPSMPLADGPHTVDAIASIGSGSSTLSSPPATTVDFRIGCLTDANCSGQTPVCDTTSNICVECLQSSQCPMSEPICAQLTRTCTTACTSDAECGGQTPFCAPAGNARAGECVECLMDGACPSSAPRCDPLADVCVGCLVDADCPSGDRCHVATQQCVDCLGNADCNGNTPICQTTTFTCRACSTNSDCSGSTPLCATSGAAAGQCVACRSDADCGGGTPVCDATSNICRACDPMGMDCGGATPACATAGSSAGRCVECTAADTSACTGTTPVCDTESSSSSFETCVECVGSSDCPMDRPVCSAATRTCGTACTSDNNCSMPTPVCAAAGNVLAGQCVECVLDSQCPSGRQCDNTRTDRCVECLMDSDCTMGQRCEPGVLRCVGCLTDADCPGSAPVCDGTTRTCRGCSSDSECGGSTPLCATEGAATGQCVACVDGSNCPADTPVCDAMTNTCRACTSNADCSGATPVCETMGSLAGRCVQCTGSDTRACVGNTPACDTSMGPTQDQCVGCVQNSDCPGAAPFCDVASHTCRVTCTDDSQCSGTTPVCGSNGTCVECNSDSQCPGTAPRCDTTAGTCEQCLGNSDCSGATPVCEPTSRTCVGCLADTDCPSTTPVCDPTARTCRACDSDDECSGTTPSCARNGTNAGQCVECTADAQCPNDRPRCSATSNTCVACTSDMDCPLVTAPACNVSTGMCGTCTTDAQCTHLPTTPVCGSNGTCVECSAGNQGRCTGQNEACDAETGTCVGCTESIQCPGDAPRCEPATHQCVGCVSDGDCGGTTPVCEGSGRCVDRKDPEIRDLNGDGFDDATVAGGGCAGCDAAQPDVLWPLMFLVAWRLRRRR